MVIVAPGLFFNVYYFLLSHEIACGCVCVTGRK
jgi:hypothetical protein